MSKFRSISKVSAVAAAVGMTASMALPVCAAPSAAEYYATVVRQNATAGNAEIAAAYQQACASVKKSSSSETGAIAANIYVEPGEAISGLMGIKPGTKVSLSGTTSFSGTDLGGDYKLRVNSTDIADISLAVIGDTVYASVPTISSAWVSLTQDEIIGMLGSQVTDGAAVSVPEDTSSLTSLNFTDLEFFNGEILTEERLDRIVTTYTDIYLKYATDVEIKENVEVAVGNLSDEYTEAVVTLSGEQLYGLVTEFAATAAKDADLLAIWESCGETAETYESLFASFNELFAGAQSEMADVSCVIETYFNSTGETMGMNVVVASESDPSMYSSSSAMTVIDGNTSAVEGHAVNSMFSYDYTASGSTDETGKTEFSGKTYVNINQIDEKGSVSQINQRYGFSYSGTETDGLLKMSAVVSDTEKFNLQVRISEDVCGARLIYFSNDQKVLTAVATLQDGKFKEIAAPTENVYSIAKEEEKGAYMATLDPTQLLANIEAARSDLGDAVTNMVLEAVKGFFTPEGADAVAADTSAETEAAADTASAE